MNESHVAALIIFGIFTMGAFWGAFAYPFYVKWRDHKYRMKLLEQQEKAWETLGRFDSTFKQGWKPSNTKEQFGDLH